MPYTRRCAPHYFRITQSLRTYFSVQCFRFISVHSYFYSQRTQFRSICVIWLHFKGKLNDRSFFFIERTIRFHIANSLLNTEFFKAFSSVSILHQKHWGRHNRARKKIIFLYDLFHVFIEFYLTRKRRHTITITLANTQSHWMRSVEM